MIEQGSQAWREQRAGIISASRFADVLGTKAVRLKYMHELVFERTARKPKHEVRAPSLAWGSEIEGFARDAYELHTGNVVRRVGFATHPAHPCIGASSDGLVGDDGIIEIKSPMSEAVHIGTLLHGMPAEHMPQVQGNMAVHGRTWVDFISYDPRQAPELRLYVQHVIRDDGYIADMVASLLRFDDEITTQISLLRSKASIA